MSSKELTEWKGFKFPLGFFVVISPEGKMAVGKCDPITKEVIEWYSI